MAQRFGGKYSPSGNPRTSGGGTDAANTADLVRQERRIQDAGRRATLLFLPGLILAFLSLNEGASGLFLGLLGATALTLAAWLTREGIRAQAAYDARKVARRPALPRKILGSVLTGIGIALASYTNHDAVFTAMLYGLVAGGLHFAAFGPDPLKDKRVEGIDTFQQDRVAKVVDEAEAYLSSMKDHISRLNDRQLNGRVEQFQAIARRMIRTVEEDPRDLTGARKFLGVYLMGARDAAVKFVEHFQRTGDREARDEFENLLTDLEQNFASKTDKMLLDDKSDMEIEIKVLRDRLQLEG